MRATRANLVTLDQWIREILINHKGIMAAFNFHYIIEDLHAIGADRIPHESDTFIVAIATSINPEAASAGPGIGAITVVVDIIVLDGNAWLGKIREYNPAACRVSNFKAVDRDVGIRSLTRSTSAYNAVGPSGTTIDDRAIARSVITESNWIALASMDVGYL